jgi:hypothetical protein
MQNILNRRKFLKTSALATVAALPLSKTDAQESQSSNSMIWGNLLHLSFNMWEDRIAPEKEMRGYRPFLRFDEKLWNELLNKMADVGMNMVVIDLGDGIKYRTHPEIAIRDAWHRKKLQTELQKCRDLGLEPIPKLNFSATHDAWLGPYERQLSTNAYYNVCKELVSEVVELFDSPRFFHLGMDEETAGHQKYHNFTAVRQFELWWYDFLYLVQQVEKNGSRPWIWSDYMWNHAKAFFERMPKNVLQSNWYYNKTLDPKEPHVKAYLDLDNKGFDQIPTASNHSNTKNFDETVKFCKLYLKKSQLLGFLQTPWRPTINEYRDHHLQAINQVGEAINKYYNS